MEYYIKRRLVGARNKKGERKKYVSYDVLVADRETNTTFQFFYSTYTKYLRVDAYRVSSNVICDLIVRQVKRRGHRRFPSDKLPQYINFESMPKRVFTFMSPNFIVKLKQDICKSKANYLKSLNNLNLSEKPLQTDQEPCILKA